MQREVRRYEDTIGPDENMGKDEGIKLKMRTVETSDSYIERDTQCKS